MRPLLTILTLLPFLGSVVPGLSLAQTPAVTNTDQVVVRSQPNTKSEALLTLPKGHKVEVLGKEGAFSSVKIRLPDGFTFDGYIGSQFLTVSPAHRPSPRPVAPAPAPVARPAEPAPFPTIPPETYAPKPVPVATPEPILSTPEEGEPLPPDPWEGEKTRERRRAPKGTSGFEELFYLAAGPSLTIFQYKLSNGGASPGSVFSYDLTGMGFRIDGGVWAWRDPGRKFRAGLSASYRHAFLGCTTILQDSAGGEIGRLETGNSLFGFSGGAAAEYRLQPNLDAIAFGLKMAYDYQKFSADDVLESDGDPLGLFVSQTTSSLLLGLYVRIPLNPFQFGFGIDLFPLNSASESPSGTTGSGPDAGFGYAPYAEAAYDLTDRHHLRSTYRPRFQGYQYGGTGTRVTTPLDGASVDTVSHEILLSYEFRY